MVILRIRHMNVDKVDMTAYLERHKIETEHDMVLTPFDQAHQHSMLKLSFF